MLQQRGAKAIACDTCSEAFSGASLCVGRANDALWQRISRGKVCHLAVLTSLSVSNGIQQTVGTPSPTTTTHGEEKKVSGRKKRSHGSGSEGTVVRGEREREGGRPVSARWTRQRWAVVGRRSRVSSMTDGSHGENRRLTAGISERPLEWQGGERGSAIHYALAMERQEEGTASCVSRTAGEGNPLFFSRRNQNHSRSLRRSGDGNRLDC
ncbi:unnamed protein product [Arctogadus glacialis]